MTVVKDCRSCATLLRSSDAEINLRYALRGACDSIPFANEFIQLSNDDIKSLELINKHPAYSVSPCRRSLDDGDVFDAS
jgi:hypothetical protein